MCTGDLSNMYLYSMLDECEYVQFKVDMIPPSIIAHYNLTPMIHNGYLYAKIKKVTNSRNWSRISVDNSAACLLPGLWVGPMFSPCSCLLE
jgi:hypothetical protein